MQGRPLVWGDKWSLALWVGHAQEWKAEEAGPDQKEAQGGEASVVSKAMLGVPGVLARGCAVSSGAQGPPLCLPVLTSCPHVPGKAL